MKQEIGTLVHLYFEEIEPDEPIEVDDFLINSAAKAIKEADGHNWIPIIVKQIGAEKYQVVANSFIYAAAEEAGIQKVCCIIADDDEFTKESAKILARESITKINLATATYDQIKAGLDYLIKRPFNPLKGVKLAVAVERIDKAPRKYWSEKLTEVTKLKCAITSAKLKIFKEVFYVTPEPLPDVITDISLLETLTTAELKKMAKKRGFAGYSKLKKSALVTLLSEN